MELLLKQTISFQSQNLKARSSCKPNRDEEKRWVLLIIRAIIVKFTCLASYPLIKSLTKMRERCPGQAKYESCLPIGQAGIQAFFKPCSLQMRQIPLIPKDPLETSLQALPRIELRTIRKQIQLVLRQGGPYCFLPTL